MKKLFILFILLLSCADKPILVETNGLIRAVDISSFPEIEKTAYVYKDQKGQGKDLLDLLKENGVNTIRLRLWVNPPNTHSSLKEVESFSKRLKAKGFKIWLSVHYSDTWADPGKQITPAAWQNFSFLQLKEKVHSYTTQIMQRLEPDYIQIGNEINSGFLHPHGHITQAYSQFLDLIKTAHAAVREQSSTTKTMLHFAGIQGAEWFFEQVKNLDFDLMGLSYYPIWHGKSLEELELTLNRLQQTYGKELIIAETAYPFTLGWQDYTNNIVGLESQLILPDYPASPEGQAAFMKEILSICNRVKSCLGVAYWGAELTAWKGPIATEGSPWENQALFDFEGKALPALKMN